MKDRLSAACVTDEDGIGASSRVDLAPICVEPIAVRRGRPSIAEAEALSGRILDASWDILLAGGFENFTFDRVARGS